MAQEEEQLTERDPNINTISEIPARKFAITMEFPLFLVMMGMSLCGKSILNIKSIFICACTTRKYKIFLEYFDHSFL